MGVHVTHTPEAINQVIAQEESPLETHQRAVRAGLLQKTIKSLPRKQSELLLMVYWRGMTLKEIAAEVGTGVNTIKVRLFRAKEILRDRLSSHPEFMQTVLRKSA